MASAETTLRVPDRRPEDPVGRSRGRSVVVGALALAVGAAVGGAVLSVGGLIATWASFTDSAGMVSGAFSAASVGPPASVGCSSVGSEDYIVWTAPAGAAPTSYVLTYESNKEYGSITYPAGTTQGRPPTPTVPGNRLYTVTITAVYGSWSTESIFSTTIRGHDKNSGTDWSC